MFALAQARTGALTLVQPRWQSLLLFSLYLPSSAHALCEAWCTNPCAMLNGDTEYECGDCDEHYECRRSTLGPRPPLRPDPPSPSPLPALDEYITAPGVQGEPPACQRVSAGELRALSYVERARVLSRPTLITGLIDNWPAMRNWSTIEGFREAFGDHGVLIKRVVPAYKKLIQMGTGEDPKSTLVPIREALESLDSSRQMHVVLYDFEYGNAEAEEDFIGALRKASADWLCPRDVLGRACGTLVLSMGGAQEGVRMATHGLAWIGLVAGRKLWYVADSSGDAPKPDNPTCRDGDRIEMLRWGNRVGVTHCLQQAGEVMVVPTAWWHATCNLEPFTLGLGGQDSCDMIDCTPPGPANEDPHALHMRKRFCRDEQRVAECFGPQSGDVYREALLRVDQELEIKRRLGRRSHTVEGERWASWVVQQEAGGAKTEL